MREPDLDAEPNSRRGATQNGSAPRQNESAGNAAVPNERDSVYPVRLIVGNVFRARIALGVIEPGHQENAPLAFHKRIVRISLFVIVMIAVFPNPLPRINAGQYRQPKVHERGDTGMECQ